MHVKIRRIYRPRITLQFFPGDENPIVHFFLTQFVYCILYRAHVLCLLSSVDSRHFERRFFVVVKNQKLVKSGKSFGLISALECNDVAFFSLDN